MEDIQPTKWQKFKSYLKECLRILKITKKPSKIEFKTIVKASGLGMAVIGLIGFIITMVKQVFF